MLQINELHTISQTCDADAIEYQCLLNHWESFGLFIHCSQIILRTNGQHKTKIANAQTVFPRHDN